jgi:hypothetical protein
MNKIEALAILGLDTEATLEDAREAYRTQVKLWHPDRFNGSTAIESLAARNVQDANRAWACMRALLPARSPRPSRAGGFPRSTTARRTCGDSKTVLIPKHGAIGVLRRGWSKFLPLLDRIRSFKPGGRRIGTDQAPRRSFRPWYRYVRRPGADGRPTGPSTFRRTLDQALQSRSRGTLSAPETQNRRTPVKGSQASGHYRKIYKAGDSVGAVAPIRRAGDA